MRIDRLSRTAFQTKAVNRFLSKRSYRHIFFHIFSENSLHTRLIFSRMKTKETSQAVNQERRKVEKWRKPQEHNGEKCHPSYDRKGRNVSIIDNLTDRWWPPWGHTKESVGRVIHPYSQPYSLLLTLFWSLSLVALFFKKQIYIIYANIFLFHEGVSAYQRELCKDKGGLGQGQFYRQVPLSLLFSA